MDTLALTSDALIDLTRREVQLYKGWSPVTDVYFFADEDKHTYVVLDVPHDRENFEPAIVVMAHIVNDKVVIDVDITNKPLIDALMQNAGIPREQIIRAYAGEQLPED